MATKTVLVSDLSGEPDAETVTIGWKSAWYETELTASERAELDEMLAPYIAAGRKAQSKPSNRFVPDTTVEEREEIRAWARENGYELADYGKIPNSIYRAYQAARA
ncbi:histone-like nucleoid-structuring protein Lsr2 [Brachybacterium saurashtrense]|uniref:Lsr2 family protein n=1 Tax=Brachybacterium saurashtrense TaxID=556288 RepID=A0A345YPV7_9MICO|nr:Lsr2 family protein [Brachybacterium saurashtrense]AXK45959.1 Lsr2 family protein [Brachybacterium saurashtrense]RRR23697.1 Lsr2 family protein [Brachybacterium saurashtrense]